MKYSASGILKNICIITIYIFSFFRRLDVNYFFIYVTDENIEVMMETIFQGEALIPIPLEEEFIVKVKDALGHILANTLSYSML